jgi:acetylornithine deacetylase/succinyl-diaminopimelate desuccinylase-like protein
LIPDYLQNEILVEELFYDEPSYTGFVFPVNKYFPAWLQEETHPLVLAGQKNYPGIMDTERPLGTWRFLDQWYLLGRQGWHSFHRIGPGDEKTAHTYIEKCPPGGCSKATEFYALLPKCLKEQSL